MSLFGDAEAKGPPAGDDEAAEEIWVSPVPEFLEPRPQECLEMVAADIGYLRHRMKAAAFLKLVAAYVSEDNPAIYDFDSMIVQGDCGRFLAHAELAAATNGAGSAACKARCETCGAWARDHEARRAVAGARENSDKARLAAWRAAAEASRVGAGAFVPGPRELVLGPREPSAAERRVGGGATWQCVADMRADHPDQLPLAIDICVRTRTDPSALGPVDAVLHELEDVNLSSRAWDELRLLYVQSGLGQWPTVRQRFDFGESIREMYGASGADATTDN